MYTYDRRTAADNKPPSAKDLDVGDKVKLIYNDGHRFDPEDVGEVVGWSTLDGPDRVIKVKFPSMGKYPGIFKRKQLKKV